MIQEEMFKSACETKIRTSFLLQNDHDRFVIHN